MHATIQIAASLLILVPFILAQVGRVTTSSIAYLVLNLVGSTVLAIDALRGAQWGFLLLEGVWALVSGISLVRRIVFGPSEQPLTHPATSSP